MPGVLGCWRSATCSFWATLCRNSSHLGPSVLRAASLSESSSGQGTSGNGSAGSGGGAALGLLEAELAAGDAEAACAACAQQKNVQFYSSSLAACMKGHDSEHCHMNLPMCINTTVVPHFRMIECHSQGRARGCDCQTILLGSRCMPWLLE